MADGTDVSSDNTLVFCFSFLLSKKQWLTLARRFRITYRKISRILHLMKGYSDSVVNERVGHVAVQYGDDSIIVWGGYSESIDENDANPDFKYWPPNEICLYNRLQRTWETVQTKGECPPFSSGSTGVVYHQEFYIFFGFFHYPTPADVPDEDDPFIHGQLDKNSNSAYVLDLNTLYWKKLSPKGIPPLKVDKLGAWIHGGKVYLFGGFGPPPPPSSDDLPLYVSHLVDPSTAHWGQLRVRGWTNQLVVYDIATNSWEWPSVVGDIPSPRAAHACSVNSQGDAFVFGGRHGSQRLNDLFHLDLRSQPLKWTLLHPIIANHMTNYPSGRSWHTMSLVDEFTGILYGGYDNRANPLGDCWLVDLRANVGAKTSRWTRLHHLEKGDLLWHCSVSLPEGQVCLIGGVTNDLLNRSDEPVHHPHKVNLLSVSPPPLLIVAMEAVVENYRALKRSVPHLPASLKVSVEERRKKFIYDRDHQL